MKLVSRRRSNRESASGKRRGTPEGSPNPGVTGLIELDPLWTEFVIFNLLR